jgi:hypothetical protein
VVSKGYENCLLMVTDAIDKIMTGVTYLRRVLGKQAGFVALHQMKEILNSSKINFEPQTIYWDTEASRQFLN